MMDVAKEFNEYSDIIAKVKVINVKSESYYGKGYQDVKSRVPWIDNLKDELGWSPKVNLKDGIRSIFKFYKNDIANARQLID